MMMMCIELMDVVVWDVCVFVLFLGFLSASPHTIDSVFTKFGESEMIV